MKVKRRNLFLTIAFLVFIFGGGYSFWTEDQTGNINYKYLGLSLVLLSGVCVVLLAHKKERNY